MFHSGFSEQDVLMRLPNNETVLYTGHRCSDRAPVVIKAVKAGPDRRVPKKVSREVAALRRCGSTSNVVGFYATTRLSMNDEEFFCIVLAYDWSMVEMFEHVMQRVKSQVAARTWAQVPVLSTRETKAVVAGLADALEWIHSQNIVHGDLKPENVLVNREGEVRLSPLLRVAPEIEQHSSRPSHRCRASRSSTSATPTASTSRRAAGRTTTARQSATAARPPKGTSTRRRLRISSRSARCSLWW